MRNEDFLDFLRYITLPRGTLLGDGTTYCLEKQDFPPRKFRQELDSFEKILVLSDGNLHVVGGVLFYGSVDIQVTTLPRYRNRGYMSAIHKNGILEAECYPRQRVSIEPSELRSMDDFLKRDHMLRMIGLRAKNLPEVYSWLNCFHQVDCSKEDFINTYS